MPKFMRKRMLIAIIVITLSLFVIIAYFFTIPRRKSLVYKEIMTKTTDTFNSRHNNCILKITSLSRTHSVPSPAILLVRYVPECDKPENKLYKRMKIHLHWYPFRDMHKSFERRRNKGGNYYKAEFNSNCVFHEVTKSGITLKCYKGETEYIIDAYPIPIINYNRKQNEIREHLRELHELIWQQLEDNSETR